MRETVDSKIDNAVRQLHQRDSYLLAVDAHERAIAHRLASYLQDQFTDWDVDCEYNRDGHEPKRLDLPPRQHPPDDDRATTVYPDIIVHRRGTSDNLLVIEMKKTTHTDADGVDERFDKLKLQQYKSKLSYRHALFLRVMTGAAYTEALEDIVSKEWL